MNLWHFWNARDATLSHQFHSGAVSAFFANFAGARATVSTLAPLVGRPSLFPSHDSRPRRVISSASARSSSRAALAQPRLGRDSARRPAPPIGVSRFARVRPSRASAMGGGPPGGPNALVPRTRAQVEDVPAVLDAAVAVGAGAVAAAAVAPFLTSVDRAVVSAAAGRAPGGSLFRALAANAAEFVTRPAAAFGSRAVWLVAGVYAATYAAANLSDVAAERSARATASQKAAGKFVATTGANMAGSVLKDAAFARMYGAVATAAAAAAASSSASPAAVVPAASYALFAARDCLTVGGAFFVPAALRDALVNARVFEPSDASSAAAVAQLVSPPLMQVVCTPMHLLALDLVNRPDATMSLAARLASLGNAMPSALLARSLRMLPAYGVGGLLNAALCARGREATLHAHHLPAAHEWAHRVEGFFADATYFDADGNLLVSSGSSSGDREDLFGDERGEGYLHAFARYLHGGLHPVALAEDPAMDRALWAFKWERLIASSVSLELAEHGGDTHGGCVVQGGGDAEVDAAVDDFVRRVDSSGDGLLDADDIAAELERERAAGSGWASAALKQTDAARRRPGGIGGGGGESDEKDDVGNGTRARDGDGTRGAARELAERFVAAADGLGNRKVSAEEIKRLLAARVKGK